MKIGKLARWTGVNASAIRYYEKMGLLEAPARSGGQRLYAEGAVDRVLLIRFAGEMGFNLAEIKLFLSGLRDNAPVGPRWEKLARRKLKEVHVQIERSLRLQALLKNLLRCKCASLKICVERLSLCPNLARPSGRSGSTKSKANTLGIRVNM